VTDTSNQDGGTGSSNVIVLHDDDQDRKILQVRLAGTSIRKIGREFGLTDKQVLASLDRSLPSLTPETRIRLFKEDLARLDELMIHWYALAQTGHATATTLCVKLMERRAQMIGADAPVHMRVEVVDQSATEQSSSTDILLRELNRIAAEAKPVNLIEHSEPDPAA
jgi:hypothetical protein